MKLIRKSDLKNDYISKFNELNKLNINYSSIYIFFEEVEDIDFLKDCNINFNQLKKFEIKKRRGKIIYSQNLFKSLLPLINTDNNLVYFPLYINNNSVFNLSKDSFEFINNFKFLEHLELNFF